MARDREKDELSSPELSSWGGNSELQDSIIQKVLARCQTLLDKEPLLFTNIYQDAWELVTRARRKAEELGLAVVITVVDPAAQVVMTYRMENALLESLYSCRHEDAVQGFSTFNSAWPVALPAGNDD